MRTMSTLLQDPSNHQVSLVADLPMMMMTTTSMITNEVGRTRKTRRKAERPAEDDPDADAVGSAFFFVVFIAYHATSSSDSESSFARKVIVLGKL